MTRLLFIEP